MVRAKVWWQRQLLHDQLPASQPPLRQMKCRPGEAASVGGLDSLLDLDQCALTLICHSCNAIVATMASAREVIMTMQSDRNGRVGLANNLTLQLTLLAAAVVLVLFLAAHYIW